ncbi:MAG: hypothetical protein AAF560_13305 [Acidobacteriota bacterium]
MRRTVAGPANAKRLGINTKTRAKLLERRYDKGADSLTDVLVPNSVIDNLKFAFRYYPQLFDVAYTLDTDSPTWLALVKRLVPARRDMTHFGRLDDFYAIEAAQTIIPCYPWYLGELLRLLCSCFESVDVPVPDFDLDLIKRNEFDVSAFRTMPVSREDFYAEVGELQGRSLAAIRYSLELLNKEIDFAFRVMGDAWGQHGLEHASAQFYVRNYLRTCIVYVEGVIDILRLFIAHAIERGEIRLSQSEQARLESRRLLDRLTETVEVFSRYFGEGAQLVAADEEWGAIRTVLDYRDRLTHPRRDGDLRLEMRSLRITLTNSLRWFLALLSAIRLDKSKIFTQEGSSH